MKKLTKILVCCFLFLSVSLAIYYYYSNKSTKEKPEKAEFVKEINLHSIDVICYK